MNGEKLANLIAEHGFNQANLAEKSGIREGTLSNIINGKGTPRKTTLKRIASALDMSLAELLAMTSETDTHPDIEKFRAEVRKIPKEEFIARLEEMGFADYVIEFVRLVYNDALETWQEEIIKHIIEQSKEGD